MGQAISKIVASHRLTFSLFVLTGATAVSLYLTRVQKSDSRPLEEEFLALEEEMKRQKLALPDGYRKWQRSSLNDKRPELNNYSSDAPDYDLESALKVTKVNLIDTHCHLDFIFRRLHFDERQADLKTFAEFKARFKDTFPASFEGCIAVFCEPRNWLRHGLENRLVASDPDSVFMTFGCHPHYANDFDTQTVLELERLLQRPNVVALGEIGLDYSHKNIVPRAVQKRVFAIQLKLALEMGLPLVLHIRDANMDGRQILVECGVPHDYKIHLHCFTSSWEECQRWTDQYTRLKVGLTPVLSKPGNSQLVRVARNLPLDRLLLETDAPYFFPRKMKSGYELQFSHPGLVIHTAAQIAAIRNVNVETVIDANRANVEEIYGIPEPDVNNAVETKIFEYVSGEEWEDLD